MRVLIVAYACNPRRGSEHGVGWGWATAIAHRHDVSVITADANHQDIEQMRRQSSVDLPRIRFHFVPRERLRWIERIWPPAYFWTYRSWQRDAYRLAEQLHRVESFDLVHQLTYVGFRVPGHLWKLGVPFVWGPIGGLENTPWRFLPTLGIRGCVYYAARNIINTLHKLLLPGPKRAFRAASAVIAATEGIRRQIRRWYGRDSQVICEVGPPPVIATDHSLRLPDEPLRLAWSGLHQPGKALPLLLRALTLVPPSVNWELVILGRGPCTAKWQRLARRLGLADRCRWTGWLDRDQAVRVMHSAHVFVITSVKDLTSTVLMEALAGGLPVICPDMCGFADVVNDQCGIKVAMQSPRQVQKDLAAAIIRLANNEVERRRLAQGALRRIEDFSWQKKAAAVDAIYQQAALQKGTLSASEQTRISRAKAA